MLIQKGGIFRQINEKYFAKYKEKGYSAVGGKAAGSPAAQKPAPKAGVKNGSNEK